MARYVVDCSAFLRIAAGDVAVAEGHELLAPTLLRSQALTAILERGADDLLPQINGLKIRYLGDGVLRSVALKIAREQGWSDTYEAEYLALTKLQGDAFVTADKAVRKRAEKIVPTASLDDLSR